MLNLIVLALSLAAPAPAANVSPVFSSCEWTTNGTTGISTEVCDGRAVAFKDQAGNYDVVRYSR